MFECDLVGSNMMKSVYEGDWMNGVQLKMYKDDAAHMSFQLVCGITMKKFEYYLSSFICILLLLFPLCCRSILSLIFFLSFL